MTSRERVEAALDFRHPDRVPADINLTLSAYNRLRSLLAPDCEDSPAPNLAMEVVPHPEILQKVGRYCFIIKVSGEDLGMQLGPLYPPAQFREIIMPALRYRWDRVLEMRNRVGSRAKVMLHSCGSVRSCIPDLIEVGIEALDPVQPLAAGMDTGELYRDFGGRIVFHGGIDIQKLLPTGTAEEVYGATLACLEGFEAQKGGFILAPAHAVQADTPPENIMAMVQAGRDCRGN